MVGPTPGAGPGGCASGPSIRPVLEQFLRPGMIRIAKDPKLWKHLGKRQLPSQHRRLLILDRTGDVRVLKDFLQRFHLEELLRYEQFLHWPPQ